MHIAYRECPLILRPGSRVVSNVRLWVTRKSRYDSRRWIDRFVEAKNIVTTEGLQAICYNAAASDGSVVDFVEWGDDATAAALGDTSMGNLLLSSKLVGGITHRSGMAIFHFRLPFDSADELGMNGETIREVGLRTADSGGATDSDDKLVCRVVLDHAIPKDDETDIQGIWVQAFRAANGAQETWYPKGQRFFASKLVDLSEFGVLDHFAIGTGTIATPPGFDLEALGAEVYRDAATWSRSGNTVTTSGTVTSGEYSGSATSEAGAAIGTTANLGVIMRKDGFNVDPANFDGDYAVTIELANA